jgi:hypothetical protein
MIAFFCHKNKHLTVVPYKCGTKILFSKSHECFFDILHLNDSSKFSDLELFLKYAVKKTFITRDPFQRYISFFKSFAYSKHKSCIIPKTLSKNFYKDLKNSIPLLKQYHSEDIHTKKQSEYFYDSGEKIKDYEIVDTQFLNQWFYLSFAVQLDKYQSNDITKSVLPESVSDFSDFFSVHHEIREIYFEDYNLYNQSVY